MRSFAMANSDDNTGGISRRQMLRTAAVTAGGTAALLASVTAAQAKMPQKGAGYQDTPKGDQKCSGCSLFKAPDSCTLVDGTISPEGWCRFWVKKTS
jgi:hypothetical protein